MAGGSMQIKYSDNFANSLDHIIDYWQNELKISDDHTKKFTTQIWKKIDLLFSFPRLGTNVTETYGFTQTTYRLTIGHRYAMFYRINTDKDIIIIGAIASSQQLKIDF